jgi:pseudaminic acid synthase
VPEDLGAALVIDIGTSEPSSFPMENSPVVNIQIADRSIGLDQRPYLVAEMSGNHNQSLDRALAIVDAAAASGADAIKLQTYTADTMTLNLSSPGFIINDPTSLWNGRQLYELYQEAYTPWEWHKPIINRATIQGMHCFSTPFDETAVDFLMSIGVPAFKIASFECTDLPLVAKVASTGKPMIISTGMATVSEIDDAVRTAREAGCAQILLLKCTSTYPATPENTHIRTIPHLARMFDCPTGLSDHTMGCGVAVAAVAMGACLIEKHFTLSRADGGVDSTFSLEPEEFRTLRSETERAWQSLGGIRYGTQVAEQGSKMFRRSLYLAADVHPGEQLNASNMRIIRPGFGLPPKLYSSLLGKKVSRSAPRGTPITWDLL